jgi:molecular chaperone Hsp33
VFEPIAIEERCTCSVERIEAMLRDNFTADERAEMVVNGEIEVVCEFCSADYHFHLHEFDETQH